jgi:hypothetical protein
MLSHAYRLSNCEDPVNAQIDPLNAWGWRFERRRLEAEQLRDALLAMSGKLSDAVGGPHPLPPRKDWKYSEVTPFHADFTQEADRRGIYLVQPRLEKHPVLGLFDSADTNQSVGKRFESTTSIQALFMMNAPFVHEQAREFAARLHRLEPDDRKRVELAHRMLFGRGATSEELEEGLAFLKKMASRTPPAPGAAAIPRQREMLVPTAHQDPVSWKYALAAPGDGWEAKSFNTSGWKEGSAGFAAKKVFQEPAFMVRTAWNTPEIWMRRVFRLPERLLGPVRSRVYHDGDAEIYLNGTLATALKGGSSQYEYVPIREEALATLHPGENVLAVHCRRTGPGQFIDAGLAEEATAAFDGAPAWASYLRVLMSSNEFIYVD